MDRKEGGGLTKKTLSAMRRKVERRYIYISPGDFIHACVMAFPSLYYYWKSEVLICIWIYCECFGLFYIFMYIILSAAECISRNFIGAVCIYLFYKLRRPRKKDPGQCSYPDYYNPFSCYTMSRRGARLFTTGKNVF